MQRKLSLLFLGVCALLVAGAGTAVAQTSYAPTVGALVVSRSNPAPGETITVSGKCQTGGLDLAISIDPPGTIIGRAITGADGSFSARVTIPANQPLGDAKIVARDAAGSCVLTAGITVAKAAAGALAFTGSSSSTGTIVAIAALAIGLGAVLVVTARRSRRGRARAHLSS